MSAARLSTVDPEGSRGSGLGALGGDASGVERGDVRGRFGRSAPSAYSLFLLLFLCSGDASGTLRSQEAYGLNGSGSFTTALVWGLSC
jgi:hypothetical protein